jgi:hypothetical protein
LLGVAITIVISSVYSSIAKIETPHFSEFYNKKFISAMTNISRIVPQNEPIVSSDYYGNMVYFVTHQFLIPYGISSEKSLVRYMVENNLTYLLVYENHSMVDELKSLFSHGSLNNLDNDFQKLADYTTDRHSRFHLYRLNNNSSFK